MGHTYIHTYMFELTVAHFCPITACGMVSFGGLLSEWLPCSFHLSRARSSLFDINATFDISLFRRVIKQNFQMCRYISQDFFFEAVVTVNLTALLVLSTMFIGSKIVELFSTKCF